MCVCHLQVFLSEEEVRHRRPAHREAHALAGEYYNAVNDTTILRYLPALHASLHAAHHRAELRRNTPPLP